MLARLRAPFTAATRSGSTRRGQEERGEGGGGCWRRGCGLEGRVGGEGSGGLFSVILAAIKHAEAAVLFMSDEYAGEYQYAALSYSCMRP